MTRQTSTKVRLVRCRCRQLLPEIPGVSLYLCGECGTILQAKPRKDETKGKTPRLQETGDAQKNEMEHVSEEKETGSTCQKATTHSTGESALNQSSGTEQKKLKNCSSPPDDVSSSAKLTRHENEEPSLEAKAHIELDEECSLDQNDRRNRNLSGQVSSFTELDSQENKESSSVGGANKEVDDGKYSLTKKNRRDRLELGDCNTELTRQENEEINCAEGLNFSAETSSLTRLSHIVNDNSSPVAGDKLVPDQTIKALERRNGTNQNEFGNCNRKWSEASSCTELTCHDNEELNQDDSGDFDRQQHGVLTFFGEISSASELSCQESEKTSLARTQIEVDETKYFVAQNSERNQNGIGDSNVSDEVLLSNSSIAKRFKSHRQRVERMRIPRFVLCWKARVRKTCRPQ